MFYFLLYDIIFHQYQIMFVPYKYEIMFHSLLTLHYVLFRTSTKLLFIPHHYEIMFHSLPE